MNDWTAWRLAASALMLGPALVAYILFQDVVYAMLCDLWIGVYTLLVQAPQTTGPLTRR